MTETRFGVIKAVGFVVALALAAALQRWRPHRGSAGSWRTNGGLWALDALLLGLVCTGCACSVALWSRERGLGLLNLEGLAPWVTLAGSVVLLDLVSYAWHRANHRVPFLWRFHRAHHSDRTYTVSTALRFHPGELLMALPVRLAAVVALGVPVEGVILFELVFALANAWEHGDIALPLGLERRLGRAVITPALHRRHHGRSFALLDSNYGTIFSFWDRLFGTFAPNASDVQVDIGLPGLEGSPGFLETLASPLDRGGRPPGSGPTRGSAGP